ncbi:MAG: protoporphyrinogen oxidase HemJ [Gemmatimonadales bacterium]|nr:protoporphyrinogen oxidase HemJ [Gemmatimonadales bacterium]
MAYLWWKAVHIIGVVSWFAGLFYLVRLFIYHAEANAEAEPARSILMRQYAIMERRLYFMITYPAMILSSVTALAMLVLQPAWLQDRWMWVKLGVVALLVAYHFWCELTMKRMARGDIRHTGERLRWANEGPTLLLILGVVLAVLKEATPLGVLGLVIVGVSGLFAGSIRLYSRYRRSNPVPRALSQRSEA